MKKKKFVKAILAAISATTAVTALPVLGQVSVYAAEKPAAIKDTYKIEDVVYYNVNSGDSFSKAPEQFLKTALNSPIKNENGSNYDNGLSIAGCYDYIGANVHHDDAKNSVDGDVKNQANCLLYAMDRYPSTTEGWVANFNKNTGYTGDTKSKYQIKKYEMTTATSLAHAKNSIEAKMRDEMFGKTPNPLYNLTINDLPKDEEEKNVLYDLYTIKNLHDNETVIHEALVVLYDDFKITPLLPEYNSANYIKNTTEQSETSGEITASHIRNMTPEPIHSEQEVSTSYTILATSEIGGSKSYGYEESLTIGAGYDGLFANVTVEAGFTASQTVEKNWNTTEGKEESKAEASTVAVDLPPHTAVMMQQQKQKIVNITDYNCPVSVSCRVRSYYITFQELSGMVPPIEVKYNSKRLADISSRKDLTRRAISNYNDVDKEGIKWYNLYKPGESGSFRNRLYGITQHVPMGSTGAQFTETINATGGKIYGMKPIYPLSTVKVVGKVNYDMSVGEGLNLDEIELQGLNSYGAAYYGFDPEKGSWKLVDANGKELNDASLAQIENAPTGASVLRANGEGKVYLKYFIDEDVYDTAERTGVYAKNSNLQRTAIIEVNIDESFEGQIEVSGKFSGYVGDDFTKFTGSNGLNTVVRDESGKEISSDKLTWEAQELPSRGIEVQENGTVKFTKEGTFHVRARIGNVVSDWVEITATKRVETVSLNVKNAVVEKGKSVTLTANVTPSTAKDKSVTWKSSDTKVATVDKNGKVTGVKQGLAKITVMTKEGNKTAEALVRVLFDDVKKGHAFYNPIYWAADSGVTVGVTGTNNFAPSNDVTRGQVIAFLYRLAGNPSTAGFKNGFKDVTDKSTFYKPILWGAKTQIVAGYADGTFKEKETCTRGQIVTFLWRMAGKPEPKAKKSPFKDIDSKNTFCKAVLWAAEKGITVGYNDGTFKATGNCTRGQMVAFLQRFAKQYPSKVKL